MNKEFIIALQQVIKDITNDMNCTHHFLCIDIPDYLPGGWCQKNVKLVKPLIWDNIDSCKELKLVVKKAKGRVLWEYDSMKAYDINQEKILYCNFLIEQLESGKLNY